MAFAILDSLFDTVSAFGKLGTAHTEFDGEIRTYGFPYFSMTRRETHTVFQAAAPSVCSVVHSRGAELSKEPAVSAVNQYHIESGFLYQFGSLTKAVGNSVDVFFRHAADRMSFSVDLVVGADIDTFCASMAPGIGEFAGRGQVP